MPFSKGPQNLNKRFLVLYLKNNIHNNVLYTTIPVNDSIKNSSELDKWVLNHPEIKPNWIQFPVPVFSLKITFRIINLLSIVYVLYSLKKALILST